VADLPARDRLRLSCYYAQGLKLAAVGRLLKEHEATVSRNLARSRSDLREAIDARLRTDHGMDETTIADCIRSVTDDAGTLDLTEILGPAEARKNAGVDRSRE
jgi:IS30 family transposase